MKHVTKIVRVGVLLALIVTFFGVTGNATAKAGTSVDDYVTLDSSNPIEFGGTYIVYDNVRIDLGPKAIYLDGSLSNAVADKYQYVYNDITKALAETALQDGTESEPMVIYIAPYVYWIDNPDATDTVEKTPGYFSPYGMVINCNWLKLQGLTPNPYNVVIAGNRGQSHASNGNYTMFRINGDGLTLKNLTVGNYCSVDLNYPLKSDLNHAKRTSTITQAQLGDVTGDKFFADNCNFISRLNLDPMCGAKRSLYNKCHFESTDDALNGNAVYVGCDFDFYGNRPMYSTSNSGSAFLNCDFNCVVLNVEAEPNQYFTKEGGTVIAVDSRFKSNFAIPFGIGWTKYPSKSLRCYQFNILHNNVATSISGSNAPETVDMTGKSVLNAYRVQSGDDIYYNTYNLLKGSDDWDPMGIKSVITAASADSIPTLLSVQSDKATIESGISTASLTSKVTYFYGTQDTSAVVSYSMDSVYDAYVDIVDNHDGTCTVTGTNNEDESKEVIINATTSSGLQGAVAITVTPSILEAPTFTATPKITNPGEGKLHVTYTLNLGTRADQSRISWYRCTDADGSNPILVAVTRGNEPMYDYQITAGDVGYYIMAKVEPKHIRSDYGTGVTTVFADKIVLADVKTNNMSTDFSTFPGLVQTEIKPGFWTVDYYRPTDTSTFGSWNGSQVDNPWIYGTTGNGCVGAGLYQGVQGARLMYTPVAGGYGDMILKIVVDPAKTAGQGFGSAGQYMDICLKFDTSTLTGYGLRIIRTKAASNAATFVLVKYDNGTITEISDKIIASCFLTDCQITLKVTGNQLTAHVETSTAQLADQATAGYAHIVDLSAEVDPNTFGGVAIQHTGTTGSGGWQNTTMLHNLDVEWIGTNNQNPYIPPVDTTGDQINEGIQTGDSSNIVLWTVLLLLGFTTIIVSSKKKSLKSEC
jgi:hypothetical protein